MGVGKKQTGGGRSFSQGFGLEIHHQWFSAERPSPPEVLPDFWSWGWLNVRFLTQLNLYILKEKKRLFSLINRARLKWIHSEAGRLDFAPRRLPGRSDRLCEGRAGRAGVWEVRTLREEMLFAGAGQTHLAGVHVAEGDLTGCSGGIAGKMEPNWEEAGEEGVGSLGWERAEVGGASGKDGGDPPAKWGWAWARKIQKIQGNRGSQWRRRWRSGGI